MASVLPLLLAGVAGIAIVLTLTALWQSLRGLLATSGAQVTLARSPRMAARTALEQEKNALLQAIRDARFEQELGKLSASDCERLEAQYRARARELLAELDAQLAPYREEARQRLARPATEAQAAAPSAAAPPAAASVEPAQAPSVSGVACGKCSTYNDPDAAFCKRCGAQLASEVAS